MTQNQKDEDISMYRLFILNTHYASDLLVTVILKSFSFHSQEAILPCAIFSFSRSHIALCHIKALFDMDFK